MKNKLKLLLLLAMVLSLFALAACDVNVNINNGSSSDSSSSESSSQDSSSEDTSSTQGSQSGIYTITFHYGQKEGATYNDTDKTFGTDGYANSKNKPYRANQSYPVTAPLDTATRGYNFVGWSTDAWQGTVTENMDVYALYEPAVGYDVTFKMIDPTDNVTVLFERTVTFYHGERPATDCPQLVPGKDDLTLPTGYFFEGWKSDSYTTNDQITGEMIFSAVLVKADGAIPFVEGADSTGTPLINVKDGLKDAGYEYVGSLFKFVIASQIPSQTAPTEDPDDDLHGYSTKGITDVLNKYADKAAATADGQGDAWQAQYDNYYRTNGVGDPVNASLYMCWDGNYIYFYIEVDDKTVVTNGSAYGQTDNPYETDGAEIWYYIGDTPYKLSVDALGMNVTGGFNTSYYINWLVAKGLFSTRVYDAEKNTITVNKDSQGNYAPQVIANAKGYACEFACPAFGDPFDQEHYKIEATDPFGGREVTGAPNGTNWGPRLEAGQKIELSMQVNTVSAAPTQDMINGYLAAIGKPAVLEDGTNVTKLTSLWQYLKRLGGDLEERELFDQMARWNAGWQTNKGEAATSTKSDPLDQWYAEKRTLRLELGAPATTAE